MKKIAMLLIAAVAVFAVGSVANAAKTKTIKVESSVSIKFKSGPGPYYEEPTFSGKVTARGKKAKKCVNKRKVRIIHAADNAIIGRAVTNRKGKYAVGIGRRDFTPGDKYLAKVRKQVYYKKKNGKVTRKIVCKAAVSKRITAP